MYFVLTLLLQFTEDRLCNTESCPLSPWTEGKLPAEPLDEGFTHNWRIGQLVKLNLKINYREIIKTWKWNFFKTYDFSTNFF